MPHLVQRRRRTCSTLCAIALALPLLAAHAQDAERYPSKPLTIVVPSVAGNVNDAVARLLGQELTKTWGQPVIVENKPGAGTTTGTRYVAQAPKDGYTVLLTFTAHVQNPPLFPNVGYDPINDFTPVAAVAGSSVVLAVSPDFPARTLPELVKLVKANPGKYPYGSYGMGTTGHILGELLKREAGLQMEHVPYKGGAPLATDLAAGHVKIGLIAVGTAKPLLQSGKLIPLAMTGTQRSALMPDVPTFGESGYKGFEPEAWMGLLMPAGAPPERAAALSKEVARIVRLPEAWMGLLMPAGAPPERAAALSREVARIVRLPEIDQRMRDLNLVPIGNTPAQFDTMLRSDLDKWTRFVRELGIKIE